MPDEAAFSVARKRGKRKVNTGVYKGPDMTVVQANEPHPENAICRGTVAMCMREKMSAQTAMSYILNDWSWINGPNEYVHRFFMIGNILTMQRNECVRMMDGDWVLFIDADMTWQPGAIKTLVETRDKFDLDIVGGLCFQRGEPFQPTLYMENPAGGGYTFMERWPEDTAVEVDATGMAFCLVHKRVFERILTAQINLRIADVEEAMKTATGDELGAMIQDLAFLNERLKQPFPDHDTRMLASTPGFFRWDGEYGEDFQFCREARAVGCRVFVDTSVKVVHIGEQSIDEKSFLREIATRDDSVQTLREFQLEQVGQKAMSREEAREKLGWTW